MGKRSGMENKMSWLLAKFGYVKVETEIIMRMMSLNSLCVLIPDHVQREKATNICTTVLNFLREGRKLAN